MAMHSGCATPTHVTIQSGHSSVQLSSLRLRLLTSRTDFFISHLLAQSNQHRPLNRRRRRVLDLDPFPAASRAVSTIAVLGEDIPTNAIGGAGGRGISFDDLIGAGEH
jgi:precorrin-6B methylase 1